MSSEDFKPVIYDQEDKKCRDMYTALGYEFARLPDSCKSLIADGNNAQSSFNGKEIGGPRSRSYDEEVSPGLLKRLPMMAAQSFDDPQKIDRNLGRPLSTHEIYNKTLIQRKNSRISGEIASNMATSSSVQK